ncbi:RNA polymerase III subunit C82 [Coemansia sp. RSA 2706]|nr:RNA polymerase III subunit C82 [Coemansia sp. RSA 2706]
MFTQLEDLCRRLVHEHYGPLVEKVAAVLIEDGRLALGRIIARTGMSALSVRQALAVLIQHCLATHAQARDGARQTTYYSINLRNILRLQRAGLYLALVEERMGQFGLLVFNEVLLNGCMSISSVRDAVGYKQFGAAEKKLFAAAVAKLVRERFITAITPTDTVTKIDRTMQAEAQELEKLASVPMPKELAEIRRRIAAQDEEEYMSTDVVGMKRQAVGSGIGGAPKVVLGPDGQAIILNDVFGSSMGLPSQQQLGEADKDLVDDKQCFRVYHDRLDVFLRNKRIINYFATKYNDAAGVVLKTMLRLTETHTKTCRDKVSELVAAPQIIQHLPPDADLGGAVDMSGDRFFKDAAATSDDSSAARRATQGKMAYALLDVLRRDVSGVVNKVDERGAGQYRINFERAAMMLRDECLDTLVMNKFGSPHARIVRALRDKQKLDEKMMSELAMMPMAQCRERLHQLTLAGYVDMVELPRTADRNPSRTAYLWYVNPQKQAGAALRGALQGIINVMDRLDQETGMRASLLAKSQRKDIVAGLAQLSQNERTALNAINEYKQRIDVATIRLDSMVLLLHDIVPGSTALAL